MLLKLEDVVERLCHEGVEVTVTEVRHFVEQGWVLATKEAATHRFDDADLARVKLIHELRQDMAVNDEAVPIVLRLLAFPMAPLILGFILGDLMEDNLRRALSISDGSLSFLWERPITLAIMAITAVIVLIPLAKALRPRLASETAGEGG